VDEQHGNLDLRGGHHSTCSVNIKTTLLLGKLKGSSDRATGEEERRSLGRYRAKVRKRFRRDHCRHPRIQRGFLYRNRCPE
jgi:hypothetical protein